MADSSIDVYLNWIKNNGGSFEKIELKKDLQGEGCVYTIDTIKENEKFATVPFSICITEKVARNAFPNLNGFSGRLLQSLFLVQQKNLREKSFYFPYINILPKKITTALYFDENDMKYVSKTNLESALIERKTTLKNDFDRLLRSLPEDIKKEDINWDDFLWAYSVYSSRAFPYRLVDPSALEDSEVLFPLVDALNHKPNTKITWSRSGDSDTGSMSFVSGQEYQRGAEIYNNYGPKSNEELLTGYGFCFEYNEYDHVSLKPNFSQDMNYAIKLKILKNCNISSGNSDEFTYYIHRNNISPEFFKMMRVLVMNSMETACYKDCSDSALLEKVGYRNELSMLSMTLALLKARLFALKSVTLDVSDNIRPWQKYALMYRSGQEDIYNSTIAKVEEMRRQVINCMDQDTKENRIAPNAPFLSILNQEHQFSSLDIDNSPFVSLDMVVITLDNIMKNDALFSNAISEIFEDLEEEGDIAFMLCLIHEKSKEDSKWKSFFEKVSQSSVPSDQDQVELREMYDSMMPDFSRVYPEVFNLEKFDFQSFIWADNIMNNYSIDNPLAVVPL